MDELLYYDLKNVSGLTPGLASQVCREIGRRIVSGLFPEGQFIDDENKLCERFNVSKSVVREAVKILAAEAGMQPYRFSNFDKRFIRSTKRKWYKSSSTSKLESLG